MNSMHLRLLALAGRVLALLLLSAICHATDDRDNTAKTGWLIRSNQTGADIDASVASGLRIVDIKTDDPFGNRFSVTYVVNNGAYGQGWWYLIGMDMNSLSNFMTANNARPTKIIGWDDGGGGLRLAAILTPNSGANAKRWWWYAGVSAQSLFNACLANNARPVSWHEYTLGSNSYSVGVMIDNTGADYRPWWMYANTSFQDIGRLLGANQARLYALQQTSSSSFNFIMVRDSVAPWWYWVGNSEQGISELANQLGARPIDFQTRNGVCNAIFVDNTNALERRVANVMGGLTDGAYGFYLKRVNGEVLASLQGDRTFEPASTIKTLVHFHAMNEVHRGNASLVESRLVYTGSVGSCPQYTSPINEMLDVILRRMMENSDNNRTLAAVDRFGQASINATAVSLGMNGTALNHRLGCGGPIPNQLTLAGIGRLHEAVANGALGAWRSPFYELMLEFGDNYAGGELNNVIAQEASALGLSSAQLAAFRSACRQAFKGGSYTFLGPTREFRSWASWISLPFYTNAGIVSQEYVTGSFVDGASDGTNANRAFDRGAAEVLRDEVHAALLSWQSHVAGSFTSFGAGCRGTNQRVPVHFGTSVTPEPNVGTQIGWSVRDARAFAPGALYIGYSRTTFGSFQLPLNLTFLGMTGCTLNVAVDLSVAFTTSGTGRFDFPFQVPNVTSLIGLHTYTQMAVVDLGANSLGVVHSNALDLVLGGQR